MHRRIFRFFVDFIVKGMKSLKSSEAYQHLLPQQQGQVSFIEADSTSVVISKETLSHFEAAALLMIKLLILFL